MPVEAVMLWNERNNKSHWDFEVDPEWQIFSRMLIAAGQSVRGENSRNIVKHLDKPGAPDVVAVHGFPLDVQPWGLQRTADLLVSPVPRIHWYSLFDVRRAWAATTRHREAEGPSYFRHFYMGLVHEDGAPKLAIRKFSEKTHEVGNCQWIHSEDHRLGEGGQLLRDLGVGYLRTGLSWADYFRPNALHWFDRQMKALQPFDVTVTFCFTPVHMGVQPHHASPPKDVDEFADFCAEMTRRYAS